MANANTTALASALSKAMASIHQRGWCDGTGGNFSCVLERDPLLLLMAPSGVDKGTVAPRDLIQVSGEGAVVAGKGKASAETALHVEIVNSCGAGAVLHTHSQAGTLLSHWALQQGADGQPSAQGYLNLRDLEMLKGLDGIKTHACTVQIPVFANDHDLPALSMRVRPQLADAPHGVLIAGHGLYAWGRNLGSAVRHLEILEFLLEQRWRQLLLEALLQRPLTASAPS